VAHKEALFQFLQQRWRTLFDAGFDILLYDLTSTYFESAPPEDPRDKRRFGYSRDKRRDCVQLVIALIITPEGFPLAYAVLAGNTTDNRTLRLFLRQIERRYGKADRIWLLDRGIPTEATLAQLRASAPPVRSLVGTPKGRLAQVEAALLGQPWQQVRAGIDVKLLPHAGEVYVLARSHNRVAKERAMRRKPLKRLWQRLRQLQGMQLTWDQLLLKLGAARQRWPSRNGGNLNKRPASPRLIRRRRFSICAAKPPQTVLMMKTTPTIWRGNFPGCALIRNGIFLIQRARPGIFTTS